MREAELCKKCVHSNVCFKDKNLFGDVFIAGNPMIFDNKELFKKYKEREAQGFPCDDFMEVVRCKDCKHRPTGTGANHDIEFPDNRCPCQCEDYWYSWMPDDDWYCANGERKETEDE